MKARLHHLFPWFGICLSTCVVSCTEPAEAPPATESAVVVGTFTGSVDVRAMTMTIELQPAPAVSRNMSRQKLSVPVGQDGTPGSGDPDTIELVTTALNNEGVRSCNDFPGVPDTTTTLCGTTNFQGRYVNGSAAPCSTAATSAADRFIHLEQSPTVRSSYHTNVATALDGTLP